MLKSEQQHLIDSQKKLINKLIKEKDELSIKLVQANSMILVLQDRCKHVNEYIGKEIRFKSRYTRNKQLIDVLYGEWFKIDYKNLNNVLFGIKNGMEYEIK